jgi:hypothetical protein
VADWDESTVFDGREDNIEQDVAAQSSSEPANSAQHLESNGAIHNDRQPSLSLEQVKNAWDRVKKRVKGRNQAGPSTSAYLNDYAVVELESAKDGDVVVIQAAHKLHYEYMRKSDRCADVEWALSLEFNQKCHVRLLAPGDPVLNAFSSSAMSKTMSAVSTQPVHREPSAAQPSQPPKAANVEQEVEARQVEIRKEASPAQPSAYGAPVGEDASPAVVKKTVVRENTISESARQSSEQLQEQPPEVIAQKASHDPVVQEVMRTFGAKIVDIRPK